MLNLVANGPSGYNLTRSLRFRSSASAYLNRTPASASNRTTWTWSGWIKRGALSSLQMIFSAGTSGSSAGLVVLQFSASDTLQFVLDTGTTSYQLNTTQVFRDPSSWYHVVVALDTTQATSTNRMKLYVNGSQVTAFGTATYPSQNDTYAINNTQSHNIGRYYFDGTRFLDGYLTEINFIDGQALTPSSFGSTNSTTGVWQPAKYTGTYGTNGFYLPFTDNSALTTASNAGLGKDFSGNSNYWVTNNISITSGTTYDSMTDVPTLTSATAANYAVLNPIGSVKSVSNLSQGNLLSSSTSSTIAEGAVGTISMSSGKWYWEVTVTTTPYSKYPYIGIIPDTTWVTNSSGNVTTSNYSYNADGTKVTLGTFSSYGASFTTNDVIGIAFDASAGTLTFYKNNVSQGTAFTGLSGSFLPYLSVFNTSATGAAAINFGQRPFSYTPPTGFVALNTYNLPTPTILKGNTVMDATTYTGNGTSQSIVNAGAFKPDFVWIKRRNIAADHVLYDSVRTLGVCLSSNLTSAEPSQTNGLLTSFNSNGFGVAVVSGDNSTNGSTQTYVGWQWQAGQGTTSSNTNGSITSTVSVNTTAGFSVVTYTGVGGTGTVGHGLGVAPKMILLKRRNSAVNWYVWHTSLGATQVIEGLNTTGAASTQITFNSTLPTSSVISLGNNDSNFSGGTYVLYVWAEIAGFSKFGSYTGNGSTDGTFVYTGFRPKYILIKRTNLSEDWYIYDTGRSTYNLDNQFIYADLSDAESTGATGIDILSNGFKQRQSGGGNNASGSTYIYMAFAENPFKYDNAR